MPLKRIAEIKETDLETANELLKDLNWALYKAVGNDSTQKVKYVLVRSEDCTENSNNEHGKYCG